MKFDKQKIREMKKQLSDQIDYLTDFVDSEEASIDDDNTEEYMEFEFYSDILSDCVYSLQVAYSQLNRLP